jgi:hypothetical protein
MVTLHLAQIAAEAMTLGSVLLVAASFSQTLPRSRSRIASFACAAPHGGNPPSSDGFSCEK